MSRPVLWIPRRLSDATLARARRDYDVIVKADDTPGTADEIIAMSAQVDAMIPCHSEHFSADVVARLNPRLKILANHSVGGYFPRTTVVAACNDLLPFDDDWRRIRLRAHLHHLLTHPRAGLADQGLTGC